MEGVVDQRYRRIKVDAVRPHPENPRRGDVDAIAESIDHDGFYGALVVQASTGYILAGNHRWAAAKRQGLVELPAIVVDVDADLARRILLVDNRTADLAGWDEAQLLALLQEVSTSDAALAGTGYSMDDLAALIADAAGADPDMPEPGDERYTPAWIFEGMGLRFDLDVAAPVDPAYRVVPARRYLTIHDDGLTAPWRGLVWMNPPYSNAAAWSRRWLAHPDGVCLTIMTGSMSTLELFEAMAVMAVTLMKIEFDTPVAQAGGIVWPTFMAARGKGTPGLERLARRQNWPLLRPTTRPRPDEPITFEPP